MSVRQPWWKGTRGEWWVAGQGILFAAILATPPAWQWSAPPSAAWRWMGIVLMVAGLALAGRALLDLGSNLTALPRPRATGSLVRTGIYAHARHPIYGGLMVAAAGFALWRASGLHLLLAAALALYMLAKARREEAFLAERFPDYEAYRARTKRLIPRVF